ncbi:FtsX domain-containing protein [Naegleria gruberi]|uniref:FtsX domain-containing protein n=1 Tax=Naegleria gruberi TaxID=5762 RepID=D2UYU7_NAEGR|nr:FtsX domain-containing protein [Naegleria gruberi]EFC50030.1 FtsX domain-containing protein [Naegleria gruberi]|eukprot:XP_002682774.1 FtsX domain-containing protein [Naegleria gruberi strain NEG-M]
MDRGSQHQQQLHGVEPSANGVEPSLENTVQHVEEGVTIATSSLIDNYSTPESNISSSNLIINNNNQEDEEPPHHIQTTATATTAHHTSNNTSNSATTTSSNNNHMMMNQQLKQNSASTTSPKSSQSSSTTLEIELEEYDGAHNHHHPTIASGNVHTTSNRHTSTSSSSSSSSSTNNSHHDQQQPPLDILKQLQLENEELKKIIQQHLPHHHQQQQQQLKKHDHGVHSSSINSNNVTTNTQPTMNDSRDISLKRESALVTSQLTYRSQMNDHHSNLPHQIISSTSNNNNIPNSNNNSNNNTNNGKSKIIYSKLSHLKSKIRNFKFPTFIEIKKFIMSLLFLYMTYFSHNFREIRKRKLAYLLGVGSCVLVVIVVCIALSVLQQVPIIFLRLAENTQFESDIVLTPNTNSPSTLLFNISQVESNLLKAIGKNDYEKEYSYFSPRIQWSGNVFTTKSCQFNNQFNDLHFNISTIEEYSKISWFYNISSLGCTSNCIPKYCSSFYKTSIYILDLEGEKRMEFGRSFDKDVKLNENEIYISQVLADNLDLKINDFILLQVNVSSIFTIIKNYNNFNDLIDKNEYLTYAPFKIKDILSTNYRKMEYSVNNYIFIDYNNFLKSITKYLNLNYNFEIKKQIEQLNLREYSPILYFNLSPTRIQKYNLQQFSQVKEMIVKFGSSISYFIGFNQISQNYPILVYLNDLRFVSMFLGLIINIIITILTILSTILIYSLLMINVENRTFEIGVLRMIGMHRKGVVQLIIQQAFLYSIPGLVIGLFLGGMIYIGISYLLSYFFETNEISRLLDYTSVIVSICLGILIPLLASLLPIKAALGQNLHDSLDTERSKTKSVEYSIERNSETSISTSLVVIPGLIVISGFCVYYFFPLSLLTLNLNFLLTMFFAVLLGMLLGLVVLALNLENMIETFFTTILLFWESVAIRQLILKNLIAHRLRNRKTTIMYAMSLGFVIFVAIAFNLQLANFKYQILQDFGTRIIIKDNYSFDLKDYSQQIESFIESYRPNIVNDFTYMTYPIHYYTPYNKDQKIYPPGQFNYGTLTIRAVPPNFISVTDPYFLMFHTRPSSAIFMTANGENVYSPQTISELLYTQKGSENIILGGTFKDLLSISNKENDTVLIEFVTPTPKYPIYSYRLMRPMCFLTNAPFFTFSSFPSTTAQHAIISFPSYFRIANGTFKSMSEIPIERLFIDINKNAQESQVSKFKKELNSYLRYLSLSIKDANDDLGTINVALQATNFLLYFVTILSMIMCFFSLVSSLYTNIQEQTKEIAILRAIGCKKFFIQRLYVYEALVLVLSASLIGIVIGFVLGFTMSLQSNLFTELPVSVYVPWELILIVIAVAFISAFLSAFFPVTSLLRNNIVTLLKRMVT